MVDPLRLQIPFVSTWEDGMHFCKRLTFANKEAVKRALIIYVASIIMSFLTIKYETQNKKQLLRFGDCEESYQRLRKLLLAYLDQDSST